MKVKDIMSKHVAYCSRATDLAAATALMWEWDCGILPVMENGRLCGVITDRDICIAVGTRGKLAAEIQVGDVVEREPVTCTPEADIHVAMAIMRKLKVRRLPVVNENDELAGLLSLNDIVLAAERQSDDLRYDELVNTVKAISDHLPAGHLAVGVAA